MGWAILFAALATLVAGFFLFRRKEGAPGRSGAAVRPGTPRAREGGALVRPPALDPREVSIEETTARIKTILITIADVLHGVDSTAEGASSHLEEARVRIGNIRASEYVEEAQLLLDEIDNVIGANTKLRRRLSDTQITLGEQQKQIYSLKTAVRVDALTKLGNRASFDERLAEAVEARKRYDDPFCLLLLDIDHFKSVNDTHGHVAGDRILKGLAERIRGAIRTGDAACRYGGEEFGIILPKCQRTEGVEVAEKLRRAVEETTFDLDEKTLKITISIGVGAAEASDTPEALTRRTDKALYRAKETGRNRVCAAGPDAA